MSDRALNKEIGLVQATKHYLLSIEGLPSARVHDMLVNEEGGRALVTSLSHDAVEAIMLDPVDVRPGQQFELHERQHQFSIGDHMFGRVVNALCDPIDGKGGFPPRNAPLVLEQEAGDLARRGPIAHQLVTGYSMIDTVLPIGKGQRQLLMGPIQSGTEVFCRYVIENQSTQNMVCIYTSIGKPATYIRRLAEALYKGPAASYTMILASTSDDAAPLNYIAPSVAIAVAEHYCKQGRDVLLILDDLYTHAKYLREIALLEGKLPGRESYPGDIFYQQAHLIERAGSFVGEGSITLLPVLQTDLESFTDLIMTNVMGTTDGHLSFSPALYAQGVFPPVSEEESVTRVGKHTQSVVQKQLSTSIMSLLAEAKEQERFTQFGSQISDSTKAVLEMGKTIRLLLNQEESERFDVGTQAVLLALVFTTFSSGKTAKYFSEHRTRLAEHIATDDMFIELRNGVTEDKSLDEFLKRIEAHREKLETLCQT